MTRYLSAVFLAAATCLRADGAGAEGKVVRGLDAPVTATWRGLPLRDVATRLGGVGGIAVVVDRRLDPDTRVSLDAAGEPLGDVLDSVADAAGARAVAYAGHVRVVPAARAAPLAAADVRRAAELDSLPASLRPAVRATADWSWPDGAIPGDLAATVATRSGLTITGLDGIPHDHFPAARLPALTVADRLDLLLAHFDRRIAWTTHAAGAGSGTAFAIIPLAEAETTAPAGPRRRAPPVRPRADANATYTLNAAAPLEDLLATLAGRFGLTVDIDGEALRRVGVSPREIVKVAVKDASRAALLDAVLAPCGLEWRIDGDTLSVSASPR